MVKKINRDTESSLGYKQKYIVKMLNLKKQKVSYWANHEISPSQKKKKKLNDVYISRIDKK